MRPRMCSVVRACARVSVSGSPPPLVHAGTAATDGITDWLRRGKDEERAWMVGTRPTGTQASTPLPRDTRTRWDEHTCCFGDTRERRDLILVPSPPIPPVRAASEPRSPWATASWCVRGEATGLRRAEGREQRKREARDHNKQDFLTQNYLLYPLSAFPARQKVALFRAVESGDAVETTRVLSQFGAEDDISFKQAETGSTPLHVACISGHEEVTRLLLERHAELDALDSAGRTPLYIASMGGHLALMRDLLARGALVAPRTVEGHSALFVAAWRGHGEATRLLLDAGADLFARDATNRACWEAAAEWGHVELADELKRIARERSHDFTQPGTELPTTKLDDAIIEIRADG